MAARKTSTAPTRIWKFSARVAEPETVHEILRTANRYYNALVAIERARHARYSEIRRRYAPTLAALEDEWAATDKQIEEVIRSVKRERQAHWRENAGEKRRVMPPEAQAQIETLKTTQKRVGIEAKAHRATFADLLAPARTEFKIRATARAAGGGPRIKGRVNGEVLAEMLKEDWPGAWADLARSDDAAHAATLTARGACGLATGTYLQIEEAVQRAKKDSAPRAPRFRAYDGHGRIAVQLREATFADVLAGMSTFQISPAPHDATKKGDQSRMVVVRLDQSVPRGEKRAIVMTAKLHRLPPSDAVVKWAALMIRRIGANTTYELQLTLEHESFAKPKRPSGMREPEHVCIGWARVGTEPEDRGVRVAHWPGGEVVVPDSILTQHEHSSRIESAADLHFDRIRAMLRRWMRGGPHRLTAWHRMTNDRARGLLRHACVEYAEWINWPSPHGSIHDLWIDWRNDRLAHHEDLYAPSRVQRRWLTTRGLTTPQQRVAFWLYTWARKDEHLLQFAADSRRRFTARRDTHLRAEAIRIATEFSAVTVDKYQIAGLKELPSLTLPGDPPRDQAQHNAQAAAPGRFRELLIEVMGPRCTPCERPSSAPKTGPARKQKPAAISVKGGAGAPVTKDAAE